MKVRTFTKQIKAAEICLNRVGIIKTIDGIHDTLRYELNRLTEDQKFDLGRGQTVVKTTEYFLLYISCLPAPRDPVYTVMVYINPQIVVGEIPCNADTPYTEIRDL